MKIFELCRGLYKEIPKVVQHSEAAEIPSEIDNGGTDPFLKAADDDELVSDANAIELLRPAGFHPKGRAYDPVVNGYSKEAPSKSSAEVELEGVTASDIPSELPSHLIFENFDIPPAPVFPSETGLLNDPESDARRELISGVAQYSNQIGLVNTLKRHRQPIKFSKDVGLFLEAYPEIPRASAFLVRATFLGASIQFKQGPSCVWEDTIEEDGRLVKRLFRQPVAKGGYPLGVAQSWPITRWNDF